MFYCKENLYAEFEVATQKDTKGKKEKYDNRIQFFKDHIELRKNHPEYYDGIDIYQYHHNIQDDFFLTLCGL